MLRRRRSSQFRLRWGANGFNWLHDSSEGGGLGFVRIILVLVVPFNRLWPGQSVDQPERKSAGHKHQLEKP